MTAIDGRRLGDVTSLSREGRERFVEEVGEHLAQIHNLGTAARFGEPRLRDGVLTVPDGHEGIGSWLTEQAAEAAGKLRGDGYVTDDEPGFFELATPVQAALRDPDLDASNIEPVLTHGDPRPANMIFAQTDTRRPLVRGLLDVGGPATDCLSDLANAEVALFDIPVGGRDEVDLLRSRLHTAYEAQRGMARVGDLPRYTAYRLLHRARTLAGFGWWKQFARESSAEAATCRFRSEIRTLLRRVQ
jgi:aminoglycoside phosphotransferase (APT) family kinase protein